MYVGELEGRVKQLAETLAGRNVVWVAARAAGGALRRAAPRSPHGLLDALLPHVESGAITIVAEVTPSAYEVLARRAPARRERLRRGPRSPARRARTRSPSRSTALEHDRLDVTTDDETLGRDVRAGPAVPARRRTAREPAPAGARPRPRRRPRRGEQRSTDATCSRRCPPLGLPLALLDPTSPLPSTEVRAFFERACSSSPRRSSASSSGSRWSRRAHRPDAAARRLPLRRPDRHRQDGDREGARASSSSAPPTGSSGST